MANKHEHDDPEYPKCNYKPMEADWIIKGSKLHKEIESVCMANRFLKDVYLMSSYGQTSHLESHHRTINTFAPKLIHYDYDIMFDKCALACLHTNENYKVTSKNKKW